MTLKYEVKTVSTRADINGNRYHLTQVTDLKTGKTLYVEADGQQSVANRLRKILGVSFQELLVDNTSGGSIKEHRRLVKTTPGVVFENNLTEDAILRLGV